MGCLVHVQFLVATKLGKLVHGVWSCLGVASREFYCHNVCCAKVLSNTYAGCVCPERSRVMRGVAYIDASPE